MGRFVILITSMNCYVFGNPRILTDTNLANQKRQMDNHAQNVANAKIIKRSPVPVVYGSPVVYYGK